MLIEGRELLAQNELVGLGRALYISDAEVDFDSETGGCEGKAAHTIRVFDHRFNWLFAGDFVDLIGFDGCFFSYFFYWSVERGYKIFLT